MVRMLRPKYFIVKFKNKIVMILFSIEDIQPICLPTDPHLKAKNYGTSLPFTAGWGSSIKASSKLREFQVKVLGSQKRCGVGAGLFCAEFHEGYGSCSVI